MKPSDSDTRQVSELAYSFAEELANSLTHGIGAVLSLVGLILLLYYTSHMDDIWRTISFSIYGGSLFALYLASTLYHSIPHPKLKRIFKTLDHCAIYLLIAGSYTPFLLVSMRDTVGWPLFAVVWGIAVFGIALKLAFAHRFHALRVATYLVMGWLVVLASAELGDALATGGIVLLVAGGITYTLGVIFYAVEKIPFNHAIWHVFVLGGSILHYLAIFHYVLPQNVA